MKRFTFRLEQLHRWRITQRDQEEARLRQLMAEMSRLRQTELDLERRSIEARRALTTAPAEALELHAANDLHRYTVERRAQLRAQQQTLQQKIQSQRQIVMEAERRVEVLDQLKHEQHEAWRKEVDKEQENLVAELVIARWQHDHYNYN